MIENLNDFFRKTYDGPIGGDCTSIEKYEAIKPVTVQEVCDYVISNKGEWGYIGIGCPGAIFGNPNVKYFHGEYVDGNRNPIKFRFPPNIANAKVKRIDWHGGWTRADWILFL